MSAAAATERKRHSGPAKDIDQVLAKVQELSKALRSDKAECLTPHQLGCTNLIDSDLHVRGKRQGLAWLKALADSAPPACDAAPPALRRKWQICRINVFLTQSPTQVSFVVAPLGSYS